MDTVDLLVVGGGTAGLIAARTAAGLGARVMQVERDRLGGDCLWTGCVPSKSLLAAAHAAAHARAAAELGVHIDGVRVDFAAVMDRVHQVMAAIEPDDDAATQRSHGIDVRFGTFAFTPAANADLAFVDGTGLALDTEPLSARQVLLATGSAPAVPAIPGLAESGYLTSDSVWELRELPRRLVVLGGGSIGCELGQAFARLGSTVHLVESLDRILAREDSAASELVARALRADGMAIHVGSPVVAVHGERPGNGVQPGNGERDGASRGGEVELADSSRLAYDVLLVAVGRRPRTSGLGLEHTSATLDQRGYLHVDKHLRSTDRRIWGAGDLTGRHQFTHTAGVDGSLAATNAVLGISRAVNTTAMPRVTFTDPEVAAVGVPTEGAAHLLEHSHAHIDRAIADARTRGFTRIATNRRGTILGATIVGPRAGETLAELTLAISQGLRTRHIAAATHPYPTYGDAPWLASVADTRHRLAGGAIRRLTNTLLTVKRRRGEAAAWLSRRRGEAAARLSRRRG